MPIKFLVLPGGGGWVLGGEGGRMCQFDFLWARGFLLTLRCANPNGPYSPGFGQDIPSPDSGL